MSRPNKQTVDYFPHYVNPSKTLRILQTQHGNDGYAFWFKMLQILGRTEGHAYDCNNSAEWLDLVTETHVPEDRAKEILETLALLDMIDKKLWGKKIIWVQHFVDEHVALYLRRKVGLPERPGDSIPIPATSTKEEIVQDNLIVASMIAYYEEKAKHMLTPNELRNLNDFADNYAYEWFEKAVDEAVKNNARSPIRYIEKILETWKTQGGIKVGTHRKSSRSVKDHKSYTKPED